MRLIRHAVWGLVLLLVGVTILAGVYYLAILSTSFFSDSGEEGYRAVFLTNGQVYFGKLSDERSQYIAIKDIFYLQVPPSSGESQDQGINLVKLGTELHGPADEMRINRDHILYIEDLRPDSRVVETIRQFKAGSP